MNRWIVGAGMTGLAAGMTSGFRVLERFDHPGGICASYERDGYHFELGGGHWIFGGDPVVTRLLAGASELRSYRRRAFWSRSGRERRKRSQDFHNEVSITAVWKSKLTKSERELLILPVP